ncbi:hypothetical protein I7I51_07312 [Histoplasma capsulatum]|uniref:Hydrophobin n=1 Tax=Ajellomyces capsulatus TaxID=5037 RepID=A0A8A1MKS2_AJECA|nr:hypothetical protein I7I51_07312 [Histoplasma capsulatum]
MFSPLLSRAVPSLSPLLFLFLHSVFVSISATTPLPHRNQCSTYYELLCCRNSFPQMSTKNDFWGYRCRTPIRGCLQTVEAPLCCPRGQLDDCVQPGSPPLQDW